VLHDSPSLTCVFSLTSGLRGHLKSVMVVCHGYLVCRSCELRGPQIKILARRSRYWHVARDTFWCHPITPQKMQTLKTSAAVVRRTGFSTAVAVQAIHHRASIVHISARYASTAATPGADEEETESVPDSGFYSPRSIEARVSITRKRPAGAVGARSKPTLSEEDYYLAAGAPGYDGEPVATTTGGPPAAEIVQTTVAKTGRPKRERLASLAGTEGASTAENHRRGISETASRHLFSSDPRAFPVVRVSRGRVSSAHLPAFIRSFQLKAAPAYEQLDGCLGAQLWIGDVPMDASPSDICTSALVGRSAGPRVAAASAMARRRAAAAGSAADSVADGDDSDAGTVAVTAVTTWRDSAALEAVTGAADGVSHSAGDVAKLQAYAAAMATLGPYFRGTPTSELVRQASGGFAVALPQSSPGRPRRTAKTKAADASAPATATRGDGVAVGEELGLR